MINYEIKSQLAKLLATEDIVVENRSVETAQFDVERRVLTLPMWKLASNDVYDMLVGHEVGHALYTPNDWSWEDRVPKQFVNVTEDARIEKLMKRRYPGLSKDFYTGYKELAEEDFFGLEDQNIGEMNLADRANLIFKIGRFVDVPVFNQKEQEIIDMMGETETFGDAVMVAEVLYKYCEDQHKKDKVADIPEQGNKSGPSGGESQPQASDEDGDEEGSSMEGETETSGQTSQAQTEAPKPLEVQTDEAFEQGTQEFNGDITRGGRPCEYIEVPKINISKIVISNKKVHDELDESWYEQENPKPYFCSYTEETRTDKPREFTLADNQYIKFKKSATKEVNYLVKEFECKKSADAYSRSFSSKTGTLDCTKLHTYKYNEDLFKKVNVIPDGKNHGLIFILDWSGSMSDCLLDTLKQLYNLVWFCSKVNIPFDVYAFTNSYLKDSNPYHQRWEDSEIQDCVESQFMIHPDFSLMHFLTSDVNKKTLDKQLLSLWRVAFAMTRWAPYTFPGQYTLSGTPLNEAIICLHELIPQFQKKNKVQKINTIVLTDGEANVLPYFKKNDYYDDNRMGTSRIYAGDFVRNRKTGHTYQVQHEFWKFTEILLDNLKQTFPNVNTIGIRIANNSDFKGFVRRYKGHVADDVYKKIRKDKFVALKSAGYTSYFGMLTSALNNETEFEVEEGASKAKIKSAFVKNLNSKSLNRKVLSQFVDIIS